MPKINAVNSCLSEAADVLIKKSLKHTQSRVELPKSEEVCSILDLSTEELGFYKYNGRIIDVIFPR